MNRERGKGLLLSYSTSLTHSTNLPLTLIRSGSSQQLAILNPIPLTYLCNNSYWSFTWIKSITDTLDILLQGKIHMKKSFKSPLDKIFGIITGLTVTLMPITLQTTEKHFCAFLQFYQKIHIATKRRPTKYPSTDKRWGIQHGAVCSHVDFTCSNSTSSAKSLAFLL